MTHDDHSALNPNASSRRRLLKALGFGAVATQLSLDWRKPAIRLGALPVHAQATQGDCAYGMTITLAGEDGTDSYTVALWANSGAGSATVDSASFVGSNGGLVSYDAIGASGDYISLGFSYSKPETAQIPFTASATCCDDNISTAMTAAFGSEGNFNYIFEVAVQDVGDCTLTVD